MDIKINGDNDDIRKQVVLLLKTREGEQALDRSYGINTSYLDMPTETAKAMYTEEIISKLRKYVTGATVESVSFDVSDGKLYPKVVINVE